MCRVSFVELKFFRLKSEVTQSLITLHVNLRYRRFIYLLPIIYYPAGPNDFTNFMIAVFSFTFKKPWPNQGPLQNRWSPFGLMLP